VEENNSIELHGKLFLEGFIETKTGLHIGGATTGLEIGGVDSVVIRDPITHLPYIPGSSLKGKMRSLLEKFLNKDQNKKMQDIFIHECEIEEDYEKCDVCKIFGIAPTQEREAPEEEASKKRFGKPTRIMVRDAMLTKESREKLEETETDLPFTEVKWEAVIDRVTSKAMPRQIERVPAGVKFKFSVGYNVFEEEDKSIFKSVLQALELLEQDYLGGQGTRGYGQIEFSNLKLYWNSKRDYESGDVDLKTKSPIYETEDIKKAVQDFDSIKEKIDSE
jgi:CRISPR-associated protein Csm3